MRKLSSLILALALSVSLLAQKSPHGDDFVVSCADCHKTEGWKVDLKTVSFDHNATKFPLIGQHQAVNCKQCHSSLEFTKTQTECISCHTDMHQQTVGPDCARCHTPNSWIVTNITQMHQQSRFPLIGPHATADCSGCHTNIVPSAGSPPAAAASLLRFDPLGIECYDCHQANYSATTKPNHVTSNYSKNCTDCHSMNAFFWTGASINHNFFPLTGGHALNDCNKCHTSGTYASISAECVSCHQANYSATTNPNHTALNFSTNCKDCHTLTPGWKPAQYTSHDVASFPIYSGKHNGQWNSCADCHTNAANYSQFTCIDCHAHNKGDTDGNHNGVSGYAYNSVACYSCHPTGSKEGSFDHSKSNFPLTGAHITTDCASCHTNGYAGTSNICASCHTNKYNQTTNPNHVTIGISNDCATCHTTNPGWNPATFPTHNNYYVIAGAHIPIANDCATCHAGNYTNSPNTCSGCHTNEYNQTTNPSHSAAQFPTTCADCHSQDAWSPSTFNHDGQYFPVYSGKHAGTWTNCNECHTTASNFALYSCIDCHDHNQTDMNTKHQGVSGYQYNSPACFACHPTGTAAGAFNHNTSAFPLTGGHTNAVCASCHTNGYSGTSTVCSSCHTPDYNQATNPNHNSSGISNDCATCHTTNPGWNPAAFPTHNSYWVISGAHIAIANNCVTCHQGNYVNSPNTCFGCHTNDYNQTNNPNHAAANFPTTCADCHTPAAWTPATFDHDGQYFPIYSGKHNGQWNTCADCHTNPANYAVFTCTTSCHPQSIMNNKHQGVSGYTYNSAACFSCHPNGSSNKMMNNNINRRN